MNFQNQIDFLPEMFDNVRIPDELDRDLVISSIVKRCGLLSPVYSEPYVMQSAIELWFNSNEWTLKHLINIIKAEYSPIENTDRYDETSREITRDLDRNERQNGSETYTQSGSESRNTESETNVNASNDAIDSVSPYDTEDWSNSSRRTEENGSTAATDGSEHISRNSNDSRKTDSSISGDENENTQEKFTQHLHGNIGVTTNQQMIEAELALMEKFHVYDWIAMQIEADLFIVLY